MGIFGSLFKVLKRRLEELEIIEMLGGILVFFIENPIISRNKQGIRVNKKIETTV